MTSLHVAADEPPEAARVARTVARVLDESGMLRGERVVIGVAGESGSGKSTTATALARELEGDRRPGLVLYQDDYFIRPPRTNHEFRMQDIAAVGPHEVDLSRLAEHVADFRAGRDGISVPTVDYPANVFRTRVVDFAAARVLVVEGTYVLTLPDLDARVFMAATYHDTRARRVARARDVDSPFVERVLGIEHEIIARQAAVADVVIDREFAVRRAG
ncbi:MAG TPA: hypothetical protein VGD56_09145 [Gemmatirosa sp.]